MASFDKQTFIMKTIRRAFSLIICLACAFWGSAQITHNPLDPDMEIFMAVGTGDNVKMDIDNDGQEDILIVYTNYPSFGIWNIGMTQIDTNNVKFELQYDPTMPPSQIGDYYARQLEANADISSVGLYTNDYPQIGDIYNPNFTNQTGKYIGFRLVSGSDYLYGWMSVELSGSTAYSFTIKEYAYQTSPNTAINAGETGTVGIVHQKFSEQSISMFPNPANQFVNINQSDNEVIDQLDILNIDGKVVHTINNLEGKSTIDISFLQSGTYIVVAKKNETYFREMLLVE